MSRAVLVLSLLALLLAGCTTDGVPRAQEPGPGELLATLVLSDGSPANRGGVGDFDGDGRAELAIPWGSAALGGGVAVLRLEDGELVSEQTVTPPGGGHIRVFVLNVDGQGCPELVTCTAHHGGDRIQNGHLTVYRSDGQQLRKDWDSTGFNGLAYADVGDLNGDGKLELVTAESTYGRRFRVFEYAHAEESWQETFRDRAGIADVDVAAVGDTNGDGKNELLVNFRYWPPNEYRIYEYDGESYKPIWGCRPPLGHAGGPTHGYIGDAALGDFDDDGADEFVLATHWYLETQPHLKSYLFERRAGKFQLIAELDPCEGDTSVSGYCDAWAGRLLEGSNETFSLTTSGHQPKTFFYSLDAGKAVLQGFLPGRLVAFGDLDADGDPDLVVTVREEKDTSVVRVYDSPLPSDA